MTTTESIQSFQETPELSLIINDLCDSLSAMINGSTVKANNSSVVVVYGTDELCRIAVTEEYYQIITAINEWRFQTSYHCADQDGFVAYYLETIDECIGEIQRLCNYQYSCKPFDERLRKEQIKKESPEAVNEIRNRLSQVFDIEVSTKYAHCLMLSYKGIKIANYWCKQQYIRLVIMKANLPNKQFSINLSERTALYDRKNTGVWTEDRNEFVLTQDEADIVLREIVEQL